MYRYTTFFDEKTLISIIEEIKRVLKINGEIIIDFATNIMRLDKNRHKVIFQDERNYRTDYSIALFRNLFKDFDINIEVAKFNEENLDEEAGYEYIKGEFLLISGEK